MRGMLLAALLLPGFTSAVHAQDYPTRPIRMIAPVLPGSAPDFVGRILAERMSARLGQRIVVENRPGAGGIIGLELVKSAAPNGYTLGSVQAGPLTVTPLLQDSVPYDPVRDFTHITLLVKFPLLMAIHPSLPVRSVKEFVALARARPGEIAYGSSGNGGTVHVAAELFNLAAGIRTARIQYRAIGPAVIAVLAGEAQVTYSNIPLILPHAKSGRVRILGISSAQRIPHLAEYPTIAESGVPGYEASGAAGLVAPAGIPADIRQRLNRDAREILQSAPVREILVPQGMFPASGTPEEFTAYVESELKKWAPVVKAANMRGQ